MEVDVRVRTTDEKNSAVSYDRYFRITPDGGVEACDPPLAWDVNSDGRYGLAEAAYALRVAAGRFRAPVHDALP